MSTPAGVAVPHGPVRRLDRKLSSIAAGRYTPIIRALAGVTGEQRPLFLKVAYNGSDVLAELARHDPSLVVGVLGGSAGAE